MSKICDETIRAAYFDWLTSLDVENAIAGTITFKQVNGRPISEIAASDAMRVFRRMLNYKAFGERFKKKDQQLVFVAVNEGGRRYWQKHPHVHFFAEVPDGISTESWIESTKKIVEKIQCFGSENCVVKSVFDDGWLDYMLKFSDKKNYADAFDILNMWTKSSSA